MKRSSGILGSLLILLFASALPRQASAVPILQMYIEGARYDQDTESWIANQSNLNLWVVGNTGDYGSILDVQLTAAFLTGETGSINITPTTTSLLSDPSVSATPIYDGSVGADGTVPLMSTGSPLPDHGIYGPGVSFNQWGLGDFTLSDSPIGDFSNGFPSSFPTTGQISAYQISISGYSMVHFDAFNHVESPSHVFFAGGNVVPEPNSILLFALGLAFLGGWSYRKRKGATRS